MDTLGRVAGDCGRDRDGGALASGRGTAASLRIPDAARPHLDPPPTPGLLTSESKEASRARPCYEATMKDLIFIAVTIIFFLLSWLYVRAIDRL